MARRKARPNTDRIVSAPRAGSRTGLDRASCGWRDAVGPGYATGVTQDVALMVSKLDSGRYCH